MNRERFIKQRRTDWQQFETLLRRMKKLRVSQWQGQDISSLSRLYRSICYDLSLVQSREWGSRLELYLNDLVAQGHNCLYRSPPRSLNTVVDFLIKDFPRLLRKRKAFFFVALATFVVPFVAAMIVAIIDPVIAEQVIDRMAMEDAGEMYSDDLYERDDSDFAEQRVSMAGFYVWNNVGIAFRCFGLGAFFGIGTVFTLLFNGLILGTITGFIVNQGHSDNFFSFVITHGSFELTAIVIAGAAGLLIGWGMVHPGDRTRLESLRFHGLEGIQLACGAGVMLGIAALLEAFFSPLPIPHIIKYVVGTFMWILVFAYLAFAGREAASDES